MSPFDYLVQKGIFTRWEPEGGKCPERLLFYSAKWLEKYHMLPGADGILSASPRDTEFLRVTRLLNDFVGGVPTTRMIRPAGQAMDPLVKRLDHPRRAVAYLRTAQTSKIRSVRIFGVFTQPNVFYAMHMILKEKRLGQVDPYDEPAELVLKIVNHLYRYVDTKSDTDLLIT